MLHTLAPLKYHVLQTIAIFSPTRKNRRKFFSPTFWQMLLKLSKIYENFVNVPPILGQMMADYFPNFAKLLHTWIPSYVNSRLRATSESTRNNRGSLRVTSEVRTYSCTNISLIGAFYTTTDFESEVAKSYPRMSKLIRSKGKAFLD